MTTYLKTVSALQAAERQLEIVGDIAFTVGLIWYPLDNDFKGQVMEHIGGSRSLGDLFTKWAEEFDYAWEARFSEDKENYIGDVGDFAHTKFSAVIAEVAAKRLAV